MLKRCPGSTAAAASCGDRTLAWQPWPSVTEVCVEGQKQWEFIACGKEDSDWWSFSKRWRRASLVYKAVVPASKWIKMSITQNTPFSLLKFLGISIDIWCVWWRFITYPLQPPNTHTHAFIHSFFWRSSRLHKWSLRPRPVQSKHLLPLIANWFRTFGGVTRRVWFSFTALESKKMQWLELLQPSCHHVELARHPLFSPFNSVQSLSLVRLFATPWTAAC